MSATTDASTEAHDGDDKSSENDCPRGTFVLDSDVIDPVLRHMEPLIDEFKVVVNSCGWHIRVTNQNSAIQFDVRIHANDFEHYDMENGGVMGVSRESLKDGLAFVTDVSDDYGTINIDPETRYMTFVDDSDRMFMDVALIDPDAIRKRPSKLSLEERTIVTFTDEQMYDFKKWVRSTDHSGYKAYCNILVNEAGIRFDAVNDDDSLNFSIRNGGDEYEGTFSLEYLYDMVKKPLKSQLTAVDYEWQFMENGLLVIEREWGEDSRMSYTVAPRQ